MQWIKDYNEVFCRCSGDTGQDRKTAYISGFNVMLDYVKNEPYCRRNGIAINYNNIGNSQPSTILPLPLGIDFNIYYGNHLEITHHSVYTIPGK